MSDSANYKVSAKKKEDDDKIRGRISSDPSQHIMSFQKPSSSHESSSSDESAVSLYTPANDRLENVIKKSTHRKNKSTSAVKLRRNYSIRSRNARQLAGWQLCKTRSSQLNKSGRFKARVFYNGKVIQFGNFLLKADAAKMYDIVRACIEEECYDDDLHTTVRNQAASKKPRHLRRNFSTEQEYIGTRIEEVMEIARTRTETESLIESKPVFLTKEEILHRLGKPHLKVDAQKLLSLEGIQEPRLPNQCTANDRSGVKNAFFQKESFKDGPSSASMQEQEQGLLSLEGIQKQRLCDVIMACDMPRASRSRSKGIPYSENALSRNNIDYSLWQTFSGRENVRTTTNSSQQDDDIDSDKSLQDTNNYYSESEYFSCCEV